MDLKLQHIIGSHCAACYYNDFCNSECTLNQNAMKCVKENLLM